MKKKQREPPHYCIEGTCSYCAVTGPVKHLQYFGYIVIRFVTSYSEDLFNKVDDTDCVEYYKPKVGVIY